MYQVLQNTIRFTLLFDYPIRFKCSSYLSILFMFMSASLHHDLVMHGFITHTPQYDSKWKIYFITTTLPIVDKATRPIRKQTSFKNYHLAFRFCFQTEAFRRSLFERLNRRDQLFTPFF